MLYQGEQEAVDQVIKWGHQYGFGNLIAHLRKAWAEMLMDDNPRLDEKSAIAATNSSPYPLRNWMDDRNH